MAKMGRPRIEIDFDQVKRMCFYHCTAVEIAGLLDISIDTLEARIKERYDCSFPEYFKKNSAGGKLSLRRAQFKAATEKGNAAMLIWLGKQYLGQADEVFNDDEDETYERPESMRAD